MAAILLDVEGVLHVSWDPVPGAARAVEQLREAGHRLRFVTNNTTRARKDLAFELQRIGIDLEEEELQTTPIAAARALKGRRVLALTMPRIIDDLKGIELVGDNADAVLIGGADESYATNQVFSYMNLGRAFAELEAGAELFCLHRNRWWETAEIEATLIGKPSALFFQAALDELDADADRSWMVGDDLDADIDGAQKCGLRGVLVQTGKFRQEALDASPVHPDGVLESIAELPEWLERRENWD
jgi:ribonucleotide monophosphatase NagD (HAD superfamily)